MRLIPITIRFFGITFSMLIPYSKVSTFILGVVFWMTMGPLIKFFLKNIGHNLYLALAEEVSGGNNADWTNRQNASWKR